MNELFDLRCADYGYECVFDDVFANGRLFCCGCSATLCPTCGHECARSDFNRGCDFHATCCPCTQAEAGAGHSRGYKVRGLPTGGPIGLGFLARKWGMEKAEVAAAVMRRRKVV